MSKTIIGIEFYSGGYGELLAGLDTSPSPFTVADQDGHQYQLLTSVQFPAYPTVTGIFGAFQAVDDGDLNPAYDTVTTIVTPNRNAYAVSNSLCAYAMVNASHPVSSSLRVQERPRYPITNFRYTILHGDTLPGNDGIYLNSPYIYSGTMKYEYRMYVVFDDRSGQQGLTYVRASMSSYASTFLDEATFPLEIGTEYFIQWNFNSPDPFMYEYPGHGKVTRFELFRTTDGINFQRLSDSNVINRTVQYPIPFRSAVPVAPFNYMRSNFEYFYDMVYYDSGAQLQWPATLKTMENWWPSLDVYGGDEHADQASFYTKISESQKSDDWISEKKVDPQSWAEEI